VRHVPELWLACFVLLGMLSTFFPHNVLPLPAQAFHVPFDRLAAFTARMLGLSVDDRNVSDSIGMRVHFINLAVLALPISFAMTRIMSERLLAAIRYAFVMVACYFLAWQLLLYGFNKLFKCQFYLPEPNIQYTEVRQLGKDMLYWTAMGTSRTYSIFLGGTELLAAVLLLWRRTMLTGALLAAGILIHVFMVNVGFDISVKLHSAFLLLLCMVIIRPQILRIKALLFSASVSVAVVDQAAYPRGARVAKAIVLILLFTDALYPYVVSGNFNDDAQPRPPLHGAYAIKSATPLPWKRFFIHRRGYFILQDSNNAFTDYELQTDTVARVLWISRPADTVEYALYYTWMRDSSLHLSGWIGVDSVSVEAERLPLRKAGWD
jgi:hypothetical protein